MLSKMKKINEQSANRNDFLLYIQENSISLNLNKNIKPIIKIDIGICGNSLNDSIEFPPKLIRSTPEKIRYSNNKR